MKLLTLEKNASVSNAPVIDIKKVRLKLRGRPSYGHLLDRDELNFFSVKVPGVSFLDALK